ncbi:hypothetical protein J2Z66_008248 [Paenibacillus eucommiae]|uniref:Uncharacterized protein n=1 Tax=Paenibacillus eucommiae TaxID=1355755 RepID=A0ABS4J9X8_9BACL|nr:hypothetical protein [Paenibacillus eucommiae]
MSKQGAKNWYVIDGYLPYKGRVDIAQPNLAYIGLMGYSE